jgi:hypothetical protein
VTCCLVGLRPSRRGLKVTRYLVAASEDAEEVAESVPDWPEGSPQLTAHRDAAARMRSLAAFFLTFMLIVLSFTSFSAIFESVVVA